MVRVNDQGERSPVGNFVRRKNGSQLGQRNLAALTGPIHFVPATRSITVKILFINRARSINCAHALSISRETTCATLNDNQEQVSTQKSGNRLRSVLNEY